MKFAIFVAIFLLSSSAYADLESEWDEIDWSKVIGRQEEPGFWDNRDPGLKPPAVDPRFRSRIRGGAEVVPHSHPYAVALLMTSGSSTFRCGASIINPRAVLTAAHCPDGTQSTVVIAGAHNMQVQEPTQQRRTVPQSAYRLHPQYNSRTLANDIAIFITPTAINQSPQIRYSRLPHDFRSELFNGELVSIVGWGRTCATCAASNVLRGVRNWIITNAECRTFFSSVTEHFFCMQTTGAGGTCPGDSGGPYTLPRPGGHDVQIGVHCFGASSAVGGCDAGFPSGATRVTSHLNWIDANQNP